MNAAGQFVLNWLAELPVAIQIALSLAVIFFIVPVIFAAMVVAITKLEERLEAIISRRYGSSSHAGTAIPQVPSGATDTCTAQDRPAYPDRISQAPAGRSKQRLRRIHPAE